MQRAACPLEDVIIATEALERRTPRAFSRDADAHALAQLKRSLAGSPRALLQKLAEVALERCAAQSAGVSLLEEADGRRFFRWHAVAGKWRDLVWTTLPRELSPCGTVLDRRESMLMVEPERYFTPLAQVPPRVEEALLVPFEVGGEAAGTVWVVAHEPGRHFDREDRRAVAKLSVFAAFAYERLRSFGADDVRDLSRMHLVTEPRPPGKKPAPG